MWKQRGTNYSPVFVAAIMACVRAGRITLTPMDALSSTRFGTDAALWEKL